MTHEEFRGGGISKSLTAETHILIPTERWSRLITSGAVSLRLPNALGLPLGLVLHIIFGAASAGTTTLINYDTGATETIFDANGVSRTSIDHATGNWTAFAAIECCLKANTTKDGVWTNYSWSRSP